MQHYHALLAGDKRSNWPACCREAGFSVMHAVQPAAGRSSREQDMNTSFTSGSTVGVASLSCREHAAKPRLRSKSSSSCPACCTGLWQIQRACW